MQENRRFIKWMQCRFLFAERASDVWSKHVVIISNYHCQSHIICKQIHEKIESSMERGGRVMEWIIKHNKMQSKSMFKQNEHTHAHRGVRCATWQRWECTPKQSKWRHCGTAMANNLKKLWELQWETTVIMLCSNTKCVCSMIERSKRKLKTCCVPLLPLCVCVCVPTTLSPCEVVNKHD